MIGQIAERYEMHFFQMQLTIVTQMRIWLVIPAGAVWSMRKPALGKGLKIGQNFGFWVKK